MKIWGVVKKPRRDGQESIINKKGRAFQESQVARVHILSWDHAWCASNNKEAQHSEGNSRIRGHETGKYRSVSDLRSDLNIYLLNRVTLKIA